VGCAANEQAGQIGRTGCCRNEVEIDSINLKGLDGADIRTGTAGHVDYVEKLTAGFRGKKLGSGGWGSEWRIGNFLKGARVGINGVHLYIVLGRSHEQEAAFEIESQTVHGSSAGKRRAWHRRKDSAHVVSGVNEDTWAGPKGISGKDERLLELGVCRNGTEA